MEYDGNPHVSFPPTNADDEEEEEDISEDYRTKQIHELEQLQIVLDENSALRAKYNALQTQVAPLINESMTHAAAGSQYQNERQITPEEVEAFKTQLENTLDEYRKMTTLAGQVNQQLERQYSSLNDLKMHTRKQTDDKISHQNQTSSAGIAAFRAKTQRVKEAWNVEKQRLSKSISFLKNIHDSSIADVKEYEEQMRTNNKGIMHLSSSITVAREDIKEFVKQQEEIEPKLKQFEELQEKHQKSEILVVELSDQIEELRKKVETDSLTAKVRRRLDSGNQKLADLNRSIDQIQDNATAILDKTKETKNRISEQEVKYERIVNDTNEILDINKKLEIQRKAIRMELQKCFQANEMAGGENLVLEKEVSDGVGFDQQSTSTVRKQMLALKGELIELDEIQVKQVEFENNLKVSKTPGIALPARKRVPMIPLMKARV